MSEYLKTKLCRISFVNLSFVNFFLLIENHCYIRYVYFI